MADRLSILTEEEINSLYSIPKLDDEERAFVFELDEEFFVWKMMNLSA